MPEPSMQGMKTFSTGAVRENKKGKGDYSLLPPFAEHKVAVLMAENADRVPARNWEKGLPLSSFIDSGRRHINQYMMGMTDEEHLVKAAWNLMCAVDTIERISQGMLPSELLDCGAYQGMHRITAVDDVKKALECLTSPPMREFRVMNEHDTVVPVQSLKTPEHCRNYVEVDCKLDPCCDCLLAVTE